MDRKKFLQTTSLGATGLLFSNTLFGNAYKLDELIDGSSFDILIIGTGYGASVTALRLAQAGKKCLMLEMGLDWKSSNIPFSKMSWATKNSTWLKNATIAPYGNFRVFEKFTGALDRIDFENIKIYLGRGVGGGSLVNEGIAVTPKKEYFENIFPDLDSNVFFTKFFPLAKKELDTKTIPDDFYESSEYYKFSRIAEKQAQKAGYKTTKVQSSYDFEYMQREEANEVPRSALDNEVLYGNNYGKKDLTENYLKKALATGKVSILALHEAKQIVELGSGKYLIKVNEINTKGQIVKSKNFMTEKLFLGAGSIGTTKLLLKSIALNTLNCKNNYIGKLWGNNGNVMTARNSDSESTGARQSTIPVATIDGWTDNDDAILAEISALPIGIETRTSLFLVINKLKEFGRVLYDLKANKLLVRWKSRYSEHMVKNVKDFIGKMNDINGGSIATLFFNHGIGEDICYHPLGGCVLGKATDMYGRLKGSSGIYITDGSLIPGTIGVSPYVTIVAIAEYCVENIIMNDFDSIQNEDDIVVYPVPFQDHIDINFNIKSEETYKITLIDHLGNQKIKASFTVQKDNDILTISGLESLKSGNYILKILNTKNKDEITKHLIKE